MLLIDYFEETAAYVAERKLKMNLLEKQYQKTFDRSVKQEIALLRTEIRKKLSELKVELLRRLEELHYLRVYFPELLGIYLEDPHIGKIISKKMWILDFKPMSPEEARVRLDELRFMRFQLRQARKSLIGRPGLLDADKLLKNFPMLRGQFSGKVRREEIREAIDKIDQLLLREGWLILLNEQLIEIPLAKFTNRLVHLRYEEKLALLKLNESKERGMVAHANAVRSLEAVQRKIQHYESVIRQLLLANPVYLSSLKRSTDWLARKKKTELQKIAETIAPHKVKERAWLNQMKKRVEE